MLAVLNGIVSLCTSTNTRFDIAISLSFFHSLQISGDEAFVVGSGDHHSPKYDKWRRDGEFSATVLDDGTRDGLKLHQDGCSYKVHVVSSRDNRDCLLVAKR